LRLAEGDQARQAERVRGKW